MKKYFKLLRVHHYIKNLLVFAALACSGQFFDMTKLSAAILGFIGFCAASSVVYIINDIRDAEKDRNHPKKSMRPIASGKVSTRNAYILAAVMVVIAGGLLLCCRKCVCFAPVGIVFVYQHRLQLGTENFAVG